MVLSQGYELTRPLGQYREGQAQNVTLVLTEECNLRCHYCYMVGKNPEHPMKRDIAYQAIDFLLALPEPKSALVLEFTGGEPLLQVDVLADVANYFKKRIGRMNHPWRSAYVFQVSSNGVLYDNKVFQRFLWENRGHVYPAITLDGTQRKHDMHRVFPDGRGSYAQVERNIRLWLRQFPFRNTKVTFGHDDLPYVCESIVHLWDLGFLQIAANPVFEDEWKPGDSDVWESQLRALVDVIIEREFWRTRRTNLFIAPSEPVQEGDIENDTNWCGTGTMISINSAGVIYPCVRFMQYSLNTYAARSVGNIYDGFDEDSLRAYQCLRKSLQSTEECMTCDIDAQCAWCQGLNYDVADSDTMFQRATFICEMHKARYRASQYLWKQLEEKCGITLQASGDVAHSVCPI